MLVERGRFTDDNLIANMKFDVKKMYENELRMRYGLLADARDIYSSVKRLVDLSGMDAAGNVTLSDLLCGDAFWLDLHDEGDDARLTFTIGWDEEHAGIEVSCDNDICPSSMTAGEMLEQIAFLLAEYVVEIPPRESPSQLSEVPTVDEVKAELRRVQAVGHLTKEVFR